MALTAFYAPLIAEGCHEHPTVREMALDLIEFVRAVKVRDDAGYIRALALDGSLVFEGAQGVLLDEWRGFHPHTTWSSTLPLNAQALLAEAGQPRAEVIGVLRTYGTRHGAGPFPTEEPALAAALPEPHNGEGRYQGAWRTGHLDLVALRYAAEVCREHGGLDALALTHLDTLAAQEGNVQVALRYDGIADAFPLGDYQDLAHQEKLMMFAQTAAPVLEPLIAAEVLGLVQDVLAAPVFIVAHGPRREERRTP